MSDENHPDGYLRFSRRPIGDRPIAVRLRDHQEIYRPRWEESRLRQQGSRCMDCGVPTCMSGCPIGNFIPDWNHLVSEADWREALARLHATNNFPEFTGYACPAPCEDACTLGLTGAPVTIKNIERAIVDRGWEEGWIQPLRPARRSKLKVAVVGSGPAGLACAQQLNRAGHWVKVFERDDAPGGLVRYGLPDFKFAKNKLDRRLEQLQAEGIAFRTGVEVGRDLSLKALRERYDAVCLTVGAQTPRDLSIPGRQLEGIHFALPYLVRANRLQAGRPCAPGPDAKDKNVIVLGGGDTGADCVATALRQGAASVLQININERPPEARAADNPWPLHLRTYRPSYAQQEGGSEQFAVDSLAFVDTGGGGHVGELQAEGVRWERNDRGQRVGKLVTESGLRMPVDLVLIAIGFAHPESEPFQGSGLTFTANGAFAADNCLMTSLPGVFAGGDARMGHSLLVWAIGEGRDLARQVDLYLRGSSQLPVSLRTRHPPLNGRETPWSFLE